MSLLGKERRKFFRHPIHAPIKVKLEASEGQSNSPIESLDLSLGGLSFLWPRKLPKGSPILLTLPVKNKVFEIHSRVVWIKEDRKTGKFRVGACFTDCPGAFTARLAEEALEILQYQKTLSRQLGKELSEEEAASRWIKEYASDFPALGNS